MRYINPRTLLFYCWLVGVGWVTGLACSLGNITPAIPSVSTVVFHLDIEKYGVKDMSQVRPVRMQKIWQVKEKRRVIVIAALILTRADKQLIS